MTGGQRVALEISAARVEGRVQRRALGSSLFFEARTGAYHSVWAREGKSTRPASRTSATTSCRAACGAPICAGIARRPTARSATPSRDGAAATTSSSAVEVMRDLLVQPFPGFPGPTQTISVRNNTRGDAGGHLPARRRSRRTACGPTRSTSTTSWQAGRRLTVNAGVRFDRHSAYLPDQKGPDGQSFSRVNDIVTSTTGARVSAPASTSPATPRRVAKASWGRFWLYPGADLASGLNPNATMWFERYGWTDAQPQRRLRPRRAGRPAAGPGRQGVDGLRRQPREHLRRPVHGLPRARGDDEFRRPNRLRLERPPAGARADQRQSPARRLYRAVHLPRSRHPTAASAPPMTARS